MSHPALFLITLFISAPTGQTSFCNSSTLPTDIIFGIDASGSLGAAGFETEKAFIKQLSLLRLSNNTKMGYTIFSTNVTVISHLRFWNESALSKLFDGLTSPSAFTNTGALIASSISQFINHSESDREKVLMIMTDGKPLLPIPGNSAQIYAYSICQYKTPLKSLGIRTAIIGIGNFETVYIDCIADYYSQFTNTSSYADYAAIMCPTTHSNISIKTGPKICALQTCR